MHEVVKLLPVVYQTSVVYIFLIFTLRLFGQRQLGQLTVIDLVIILLLGSCVETSMIDFNTSLPAGLVSAATLLIINRLFAVILPRFSKLKCIVQCEPVLLIHDGEFIQDHLRRMGLTQADVLEALRERENADISQVKDAVLESDGEINVVPNDVVVLHSKHKVKHQQHTQKPA